MTEIDIRPATAETARHLTDRIKVAVEGTWMLIQEAYLTRAWAALGYGTWDEYCTREFGTSRLRLPREERQEVVASLHESGLSSRAIAAATGLGKGTVQRELSTGPNGPVGTESNDGSRSGTGIDGKTRVYPPRPSPPAPSHEHEPEPSELDEQAGRLDRMRQMAEQAEQENPPAPIRELLDLQSALQRAIPKMRALKEAGQDAGAGALTARIADLWKEMEKLL